MNRPPFDLVEAEQELVGGFNTEYSLDPLRPVLPGRVHERGHHVGDHRHPVPRWPRRAPRSPGTASGPFWFLVKVFVFLFIFVWFRATLPRFRYDQLMDLGWKRLIPVALGWLLLVAAVRSGSRDRGSASPCSAAWSSAAPSLAAGPAPWAGGPPRSRPPRPATPEGRCS